MKIILEISIDVAEVNIKNIKSEIRKSFLDEFKISSINIKNWYSIGFYDGSIGDGQINAPSDPKAWDIYMKGYCDSLTKND
ncbi:MAG: hypothetical protein ACTSRU_14210 [Candidatus Hodarchaeales archaeon]